MPPVAPGSPAPAVAPVSKPIVTPTDGNTAASVIFTGSPNWSARAQHSDEVWVRILGRPTATRQYQRHVNHLYALPFAHSGTSGAGELLRHVASGTTGVPAWFEAD